MKYEPGAHIEQDILHAFQEENHDNRFHGMPVTVTMRDGGGGIARTSMPRNHHPRETNLSLYSVNHFQTEAVGSIQAIDPEHNTLWLSPQRLTLTSLNIGYLAAVGFADDVASHALYDVQVRELSWRDEVPGKLMSRATKEQREAAYAKGTMPDLIGKQWEMLGVTQ